MIQVRCELHSHTRHSDGAFTAEELLEKAKRNKLGALAITDHNTISVYGEKAVREEKDLTIIKGLEWTTFYGHILFLNVDSYYDWRVVEKSNLEETLRGIRARSNALIGVAHPCDVGSPISTGSHFDFENCDLSVFDYMEVWHSGDPAESIFNERAKETWLSLLDSGKRMTTCYGRDWHRDSQKSVKFAMTIVQAEENTSSSLVKAIKEGRALVSYAPKVELTISSNDKSYTLGDCVKKGKYSLRIKTITENMQGTDFDREIEIEKITLFSEGKRVVKEYDFSPIIEDEIELSGLFLRAELSGTIAGAESVIAFTNAIYVKRD